MAAGVPQACPAGETATRQYSASTLLQHWLDHGVTSSIAGASVAVQLKASELEAQPGLKSISREQAEALQLFWGPCCQLAS